MANLRRADASLRRRGQDVDGKPLKRQAALLRGDAERYHGKVPDCRVRPAPVSGTFVAMIIPSRSTRNVFSETHRDARPYVLAVFSLE